MDFRECASYLRINITEMNCTAIKEELTFYNISSCGMQRKTLVTVDGMNILGIVVFSLCFAISLGLLGERGQNVISLVAIMNDAIMKLVTFIMW